MLKHGPRVRITHERFESVEGYFASHGGKTILVGRFIGLVRALAPFIAGSSGMQYRAFVPYSVLGTGLWAAAFSLLGYAFSQSLDKAGQIAGHRSADLRVAGRDHGRLDRDLALSAQAGEPRQASRRGSNRSPRAAAAAAADPLHLEPDHAGQPRARVHQPDVCARRLAVRAVGYAIVVSGDPGPTPGDTQAIDIVDSLRTDWLTELAKVVTRWARPR